MAGSILRTARERSGLSQAELARRAGIAQSVISVYENGRRQPSVPTLARLTRLTGHELMLTIRSQPQLARLDGPLGQRILSRRDRIQEVAGHHGARVLGVFGSVARGDEGSDSDIDLLVELPPTMGLLGLGRFQEDLGALLEAGVDVVPESDLKPGVRQRVLDEMVGL